jgi:hypothetical protein
MATAAGVASGLVQAAGAFRWVFAVPTMAYAHASAHPLQQLIIAEAFNALHQYAGVALAEHLGQMLLVAWTAGVSAACWRVGGTLRYASYIGMLSVPLWLIGQTELYATVIPQVPVVETAQIAFLVWMLFLLALACALTFRPIKRRLMAAAPAVTAEAAQAEVAA